MPIMIRLPDGSELAVQPHGDLDLLLYINGVLPIRRDHGHIDPDLYRAVRDGDTIITTCRICGDFLGRRPVKKPTRRRTR